MFDDGMCDAQDALTQVRAAVIDACATEGLRPVTYEDFVSVEAPGDEVMLIEREAGPWIGVKSQRWELAPPAGHPLALRLSRRWPVLGMRATQGHGSELCLYRRGAPAQYAVHGRTPDAAPTATSLDFALLAERAWLPVDEAELRAAFGDPGLFANLTGISASGCAAFLADLPLSELPDASVLFRQT